MALKQIDQDTIQPGGKRGLPGRTSFAIVNENTTETEQRLSTLEGGSGGVSASIAALREGLAGEAQTRAMLDDELGAQIDAEQIARQTGDEALAARIGRIPGKNVLINGNFEIASRGTSGAISQAALYTADRWICSALGAVCNWGIGGTAAGEIAGSRRFLGFNIVAGTTSAWIGQRVEGAWNLAGDKGTVSFWMRCSVAGRKVGLRLQQVFGSGGSTLVDVEGPVLTLGVGFQKYTVTFDVPPVAGKTFGANDNLLLAFFLNDNSLFAGQLAGQTGLFEIAQVQGERGPTATAYDMQKVADVKMQCERYTKEGRVSLRGASANISATGAGTFLAHSMRATPAVTFSNTTYAYGCSGIGSAPFPSGTEIFVSVTGSFAFASNYLMDAEIY